MAVHGGAPPGQPGPGRWRSGGANGRYRWKYGADGYCGDTGPDDGAQGETGPTGDPNGSAGGEAGPAAYGNGQCSA